MADLEKKETEAAVEVAEEVKETEKTVDKKEKSKKATPKKNKIGLGQRISKFFKDYKSELKKITWSSMDQTRKGFLVAIVVTVIFAVGLLLIDLAFGEGISYLDKLFR